MRKKLRNSQIIVMLAPAIITSLLSIFISGIQLKNIELIKKSGDFATPLMVAEAKAECRQYTDDIIQKHEAKNEEQNGEIYDRINKIYDFLIKDK